MTTESTDSSFPEHYALVIVRQWKYTNKTTTSILFFQKIEDAEVSKTEHLNFKSCSQTVSHICIMPFAIFGSKEYGYTCLANAFGISTNTVVAAEPV